MAGRETNPRLFPLCENNTTVVLRLGGKTKIGLVRFLETSERLYSFDDFRYDLLEFDKLEEVFNRIGTDAFSRARNQRRMTWRSTYAISREAIVFRAITFSQVPKKFLPAVSELARHFTAATRTGGAPDSSINTIRESSH